MLMMFAITIVETKSNIQTKSLESIDSMQRQFTYADLVRITNNFETVLGKGGSGQVYQGCIDDTQVAVKVLFSIISSRVSTISSRGKQLCLNLF